MDRVNRDYRIRAATAADTERLTALRVALLRESGFVADEAGAGALSAAVRSYLDRSLPTGEFRAWVAEAGGQIVGVSGLVFVQKPPLDGNLSGLEAYVLNMYTAPEWRRRGIASALLMEVLACVRATRAVRVRLHATEMGARVYRAFGFQSVDSEMVLSLDSLP